MYHFPGLIPAPAWYITQTRAPKVALKSAQNNVSYARFLRSRATLSQRDSNTIGQWKGWEANLLFAREIWPKFIPGTYARTYVTWVTADAERKARQNPPSTRILQQRC